MAAGPRVPVGERAQKVGVKRPLAVVESTNNHDNNMRKQNTHRLAAGLHRYQYQVGTTVGLLRKRCCAVLIDRAVSRTALPTEEEIPAATARCCRALRGTTRYCAVLWRC